MADDIEELQKAAKERLDEVLQDLHHLGLLDLRQDKFALTDRGFMELMSGSINFIRYVDSKGVLEAFLKLAEVDEEEAMVCMVVSVFIALLAHYKREKGIPDFNMFDLDYVFALMSLGRALVNLVPPLRSGLKRTIKLAKEIVKRRCGGGADEVP